MSILLRSRRNADGRLFSTPFLFITLITIFVLIGGCGYHHQGYRSRIDGSRPRIHVNIWDNKSREFGVEGYFNQAIINWLQESRELAVVFSQKEADYIIDGRVERLEFVGTAYDTHDTPTALKAVMDTSWKIIRTSDNHIVWKKSERRESGYGGGKQAVMIRSNRQQALKTMASEVAEQLYIQLTHLLAEKVEEKKKTQ